MNGNNKDYKPQYTDTYIRHLIHLANDTAKMNILNIKLAQDTLKALGIKYKE